MGGGINRAKAHPPQARRTPELLTPVLRIIHRAIGRFLLRQAGLKTIDAMPALRQEGDAYLPLDTHLNARGHEVVGEVIARALEE